MNLLLIFVLFPDNYINHKGVCKQEKVERKLSSLEVLKALHAPIPWSVEKSIITEIKELSREYVTVRNI